MRTGLAVAIAMMMLPGIALGQDMRHADGKPCYPTEETYYDQDGTTPFACVPSGGPEYHFKVFVGDKLLWEGVLPSTKSAVYFDMGPHSDTALDDPRLFVERDLSADPMGSVVSFGEAHLQAFESHRVGGSTLQFPRVRKIGLSMPVGDNKVSMPMDRIHGTEIDFTDYRIVVHPAS